MAFQVRQDGEHLFKHLARAIRESGYMHGDDSVATTGGCIRAAIYVIDRMHVDLAAAKRRVGKSIAR